MLGSPSFKSQNFFALLVSFDYATESALILKERANGMRYPLVGGTRERRFDGTNFKPQKMLENAATPTSRVHAVLGSFWIICLLHLMHSQH